MAEFRHALDPEITRSKAERDEARRDAAAAMADRDAAQATLAQAQGQVHDATDRLDAARRDLSDQRLGRDTSAAATWARNCVDCVRDAEQNAGRAAARARLFEHRFRATNEHLDRVEARVRTLDEHRQRALTAYRRQLERRIEAVIEDEARVSAFSRAASWSGP